MEDGKQKLIELFKKNVLNKSPNIEGMNKRHDGAKGQWLEAQFGKSADSANQADFWGYECKNHTSSKTTWGDWTANYYIFDDATQLTRDRFLQIFGTPNMKKHGRYSWSGKEVPTRHNDITKFGQSLIVDSNLDISIFYNFNKDNRVSKNSIIPKKFQEGDILLAKWVGYEKNNDSRKKSALETKVNNKFNQKGWFKCSMVDGAYNKIIFGDPLPFEEWIRFVLIGDIYFDSGMYEGNSRPYSVWRSDNKFWDKLVTSSYPKDE